MKRKTMEIKVVSKKENPLLKREAISFQIEHTQTKTPSRTEVRKAVAKILKTDMKLVYVKKFKTKTGTSTAVGIANVYDSEEQAKFVEPEYVIKRNVSAVKPEAVKPEAVKPEAVKPEAVKPEAVKPEAVKPEANKEAK
jgi:ribosomal protein S24E